MTGFSHEESTSTGRLCLLYSTGILGLYMLLPVLSPYAQTLPGHSDLLVGLSVGVYGLTQTVFQIPFGYLSDRIGRTRAIFLGLLLFFLGSLVAAAARSIEVLIWGRLLQGAGAVSSVVASLLADLTRPDVRTQAMGRLTLAVGGALAIGVIAGPLIGRLLGVRALLNLTGYLSLAAGVAILILVPSPRVCARREPVRMTDLLAILGQKRALLLDGGTLLSHAVVTLLFVILPFDLTRRSSPTGLWIVALPIGAIWLAAILLASRWSDSLRRPGTNLYIGFALLALSCLGFAFWGGTLPGTLAGAQLFLLSAAFLEPGLPSTMSRFAVGLSRGTAMGVFSMSQFLGAFCGGLLGGVFLQRSRAPLFLGLSAVAALWLFLMYKTGGWRPAEPLDLSPLNSEQS